ncbi:arsenic resistance protein [Desulfotomaculum nigrificans]|uniref:arsenic resistance protein n=1 Tax=Desulfotomaculum nigrificans TaxID=1565 RepID=UPI0001FAF0D4|nr:bile acid:sodium symporter [Desulfotomaculum nigrificans]
MKTLLFLPSRNLALTIPIVLMAGFIVGLSVDTAGLKNYILPVSMLMIYPIMIGFSIGELLNLSHTRLILTAGVINFAFIPLAAYLLGKVLLSHDPQLFAGLAVASLLPTSNMTIAFTMFTKGNVTASIKMTVAGLVAGSLLAPWYLLAMVGKYIPFDVLFIIKTLGIVVFIPLILGNITYSFLLRKYTHEQFNRQIKPYLPAISAWGAIYIVFTSISINAYRIVANPKLLLNGLLVQVIFYVINYFIVIKIGRHYFNKEDAISLVYGTVLRNLSISIGLAATAFGPRAALMVSLAFLFQGQAAAWFSRLVEKNKLRVGKEYKLNGSDHQPVFRDG